MKLPRYLEPIEMSTRRLSQENADQQDRQQTKNRCLCSKTACNCTSVDLTEGDRKKLQCISNIDDPFQWTGMQDMPKDVLKESFGEGEASFTSEEEVKSPRDETAALLNQDDNGLLYSLIATSQKIIVKPINYANLIPKLYFRVLKDIPFFVSDLKVVGVALKLEPAPLSEFENLSNVR